MAITTCYRVQPVGLSIDGHRSVTSNDNLDVGCHVFGSLSELCGGVTGWCRHEWQPEILEIQCDVKSLRDNGDYEGYVLAGRGEIVARKAFATWRDLIEWAKEYPATLFN